MATGVALDIDFALWTDEASKKQCESTGHYDSHWHDSDPTATHYAMLAHNCVGQSIGYKYAVCKKFAAFIKIEKGVHCYNCNQLFPDKADWVIIVGELS